MAPTENATGKPPAPPRRRLWSWLLAIPLAAVLLYFSLRGVDWHIVWRAIAAARLSFLAAAALLMCLSFFLRSLRWRILLNAEGRLSIAAVFRATMAGYLGNAFLPARAGEVVRILVVSGRSSLSKTYVLTTALCERLMDAIALVLWSSLILLSIDPKPRWMADVSRTTAVLAAFGALAIAVAPHTEALCLRLLQHFPLPAKLRARLLTFTGQVLLGMRAFHHTGRFFGFAALTVLIWTSDTAGTIIGARALGIHLSVRVALLLIAAMGLGSALPSTPGYVGIYQFVAVTVLVPFGVAKDLALAYILVAQAMAYIVTAALGLPCLAALRKAPHPAPPVSSIR
jgi:glycosyltransferase 2 family protein